MFTPLPEFKHPGSQGKWTSQDHLKPRWPQATEMLVTFICNSCFAGKLLDNLGNIHTIHQYSIHYSPLSVADLARDSSWCSPFVHLWQPSAKPSMWAAKCSPWNQSHRPGEQGLVKLVILVVITLISPVLACLGINGRKHLTCIMFLFLFQKIMYLDKPYFIVFLYIWAQLWTCSCLEAKKGAVSCARGAFPLTIYIFAFCGLRSE